MRRIEIRLPRFAGGGIASVRAEAVAIRDALTRKNLGRVMSGRVLGESAVIIVAAPYGAFPRVLRTIGRVAGRWGVSDAGEFLTDANFLKNTPL